MTLLAQHERPALIQRMSKRAAPLERYVGPDRLWSMEYMGSAEFEFGALPEALRRMAAHRSRLQVVRHQSGDSTLWSVGLSEHAQTITGLLARELEEVGVREWFLKEHTGMRAALGRDTSEWYAGRSDPTMAWWAIDALHSPFAIFQQEQDAHDWLERLGAWAESKEIPA